MQIVGGLDEQFARLHERSVRLVQAVPFEKLYWQPPQLEASPARTYPLYSCGEHILRSAAAVEQTFGGITVNLWDDPFEWTLPESLPEPSDVVRYLEESEAARQRAFLFFKSDEDLTREIAVPSGETRSLFSLIVETLARASHHQGRAYATFRLFSDEKLPRV
jgi:hypothetical protein